MPIPTRPAPVILNLLAIVIVCSLTFFLLEFPAPTARFLGFRDSQNNKLFAGPGSLPIANGPQPGSQVLGAASFVKKEKSSATAILLRGLVQPFSRASLVLVEKISPKTYGEVVPENINDVLGVKANAGIVPGYPIILPNSSYLKVPDKGLIKNLNADYLRGRIPGESAGNLAYFSVNGGIQGLSFGSLAQLDTVNLAAGEITGILGLANGGTGANLSSGTKGGFVFMADGQLSVTDDLTGVLIGNGSSSPTSVTGSQNYITKWGTGGNTLSNSSIYDNGNVGIGNTDPEQPLDVSGNVYARGGQIRIGNFAAPPGAIGSGSLYYDTGSNQVFYFNGTSWTAFGTGSGGGDSVWTTGLGVIYPVNLTVDALIGGTSTASAKFGFINVNSGTPAIQINGTTVLNPTTLGSGVVNSSLTSVGALTGGSIASGFGTIATGNTITGTTLNGTTGINTGAGAGTQRIDSSGNLVNIGTITSGLINGQTISSAANFTGSLTAAGGITFSTFTSNGGPLYTNGSGVLAQTTAGTSSQCLLGGTNPTFGSCTASGDAFWNQTNGALYPNNSTVDLLVGGQSTTSAKFAVLGVNNTRGTQTASLSGSITLDSSSASIQTTNGQSLVLGGTTTGLVNINNKAGSAFTTFDTVNSRVGIGTSSPTSELYVTRPLSFGTTGKALAIFDQIENQDIFTASASGVAQFVIQNDGDVGVGTANPGVEVGTGRTYLTISGDTQAGMLELITQQADADTVLVGAIQFVDKNSVAADKRTGFIGSRLSGTTANNRGGILDFYTKPDSGTIQERMRLSATGLLGLGTNAPISELHVTRAVNSLVTATGKALAIFDQIENQDIFTASKSGTTKFTVDQNGNISFAGGQSVLTTIASLNTTARTITIPQASGADTFCLQTLTNCFSGATTNYWQLNSNAISPSNSTYDVLIGSTATSTAKFAFTGLSSATNQTQASFSGKFIVMPNNGYGNVGIGTTTPGSSLGDTLQGTTVDISGTNYSLLRLLNTTTGNEEKGRITFGSSGYSGSEKRTAVIRSFSENAATDNPTGDLEFFTANAGTIAERLRITGAGLVGIGTSSPISQLHLTRPLSFGATGKALAIFDQIENQDILTASKSGTTKFTVDQNGNISFAGGQSVLTTIASANTTARTITIPQASGSDTFCLLTLTNCFSGATTNYWQLNSNALSPSNSTYDLLVGATATSSANFAVLNNAGGTPVASVAGNFIVMPKTSGTSQLGGNIGIGVVSPSSRLSFSNSWTAPGAETVAIDIFNGTTSGGLPAYGFGMGPTGTEGYINYRSGTSSNSIFGHKFTVNNVEVMRIRGDGNVGIGDSSPASLLTVGSGDLFQVNSSGNVIQGLDFGARINSYGNSAATSGTVYGGYFRFDSIPTSASTLTVIGLQAVADHHSASTVGISALQAINGTIINEDTTTVGDAYGLVVALGANSGTITNTYGVYISDMTTGTQTNQAYGLYQVDTGARNYFGGNVGIGTSPDSNLHVYRGSAGTSFKTVGVAAGNLTDSQWDMNLANGNSVTYVRLGVQATNGGAGVEAADFYLSTINAGTLAEKFRISANGTAKVTINDNNGFFVCKASTSTGYMTLGKCNGSAAQSDLTEAVTGPNLEAGDIVEFDSGALQGESTQLNKRQVYVKKAEDKNKVAGIISTWGIQFDTERLPSPDNKPMSTSGVAPVKVNLEGGVIRKGDPITSSSTPGVGMKAKEAGYIVARATEDFDGSVSSSGKILALITVAWYDPDVYLTDSGVLSLEMDPATELGIVKKDGKEINRIGAFKELVAGKIRAGNIQAKNISTDSLTVEGKGLAQYIRDLSSSQSGSLTIDASKITTDSLNITTDQITIDGKTLAEYIDKGVLTNGANKDVEKRIASLESQMASMSGVLNASTKSAELNQSLEDIQATEAEIASLSGAISNQPSAISSTEGKFARLRVTGSGLIEGVLTVIDTLMTQNLVANGVSTFFGEAIFKDGVRFEGLAEFNKDTAGAVIIKEGSSNIKVKFDKKYKVKPIVNVSLTAEGTSLEKEALSKSEYSAVVTDVSTEGFNILLNKDALTDIKINWIAIQTN